MFAEMKETEWGPPLSVIPRCVPQHSAEQHRVSLFEGERIDRQGT